MAYVQYGPFVNGSAPGLAAAFFNPLETFLLSLNSASYDSHITADGSGNITAIGTITFLSGSAKIMIAGGSAIVDASAGTDIKINAPNTGGGHKVYLQVGGVNVMSVNSAGSIVYLSGGTAPSSGTP